MKSPSAPPAADSTDREAALPPPAPIAPEAAPVAEAAPAKKPSLLIVPADDDGAHEDDAAPGQRVSLLDLYRSQSSPNVALAHAAPIALPDEDDSNEVDVLLEKAAAASRELESETACALLRAALVADPTRADVAERLAREAEASGSDVERVLALSAIVPPARAVAAWEVSPQAARGTLAAHLVHPAHAPILEVLGRVYESCQPIFRTTLAQLGVLGTDRVGARAATPVARALLATMELFGWEDPQVFLTRRPLASELVRTQPPALLLGLGLPRGEREVRFVVARGLTLARPENVLVASLPEPEGRTLFAAIRAAFGPADGTRVPREAAAMAAELWRLLPPQRQRDVRELLHDRWALLDYDAVRASVLGGAARAGLLVAGDVGAALRALGALETPPVVVAEGRPWIEMARTHGAAADLLRFAFGDALVESARLSR